MEQSIISTLIGFFSVMDLVKTNLQAGNPALLDLAKMVIGITVWIGGLVGFLYIRNRKLKAALNK